METTPTSQTNTAQAQSTQESADTTKDTKPSETEEKRGRPMLFFVFLIIILIGGFYFFSLRNSEGDSGISDVESIHRTSFADFDPVFRVSAVVPSEWEVEYLADIEALNIFDPEAPGENSLEQSQIFIRNFVASDFLTLPTVDILDSFDTVVNGHEAIEYEIVKKDGTSPFAQQPSWRNETHRSVDIRFESDSEGPFYTFAYNPGLDRDIYDAFIDSLVFHNDRDSLQPVIDRAKERITLKPYGLFVSPENSPMTNEQYTGFHNAVDFEALKGELFLDTSFTAFCGGTITDKRFGRGYGGILVQDCLLEGQGVQVLYGHVDVDSIAKNIGDYLSPGERVGVLGEHESEETAGERKHLHFSIYQGPGVDIRGYVPTEAELSLWIDPGKYLELE